MLGTDVQVAAKLSPMFSVMGTKVSCGYNFMYVISEDVQCFSWGCGKHGVLGHGDTSDRLHPCLLEIVKVYPDLLQLFTCQGQGHRYGHAGHGRTNIYATTLFKFYHTNQPTRWLADQIGGAGYAFPAGPKLSSLNTPPVVSYPD